MSLSVFHPLVAEWFERTFGKATDIQAQAWPHICAGRDTLIAAPTGSGKTLAAFLSAIDDLARLGAQGILEDKTYIVYVSPLKALSNDIARNLTAPVQGIGKLFLEREQADIGLRVSLRTGDTPVKERTAMTKLPPHILVTTPESLYMLLTSDSGRKMLSQVRTLIVDEIHAMFDDKRGSHLALTMERLQALVPHRLHRIGLSATQKPMEEVAKFLTGNVPAGKDGCVIINTGHRRVMDLAVELPRSPLTAVMANEVWEEIYERLETLIKSHGTTLIFVNTRRLSERLSHHLRDRIGAEHVAAHHGSMSKERRLEAEQNLKEGKLRVIVATASLELGIDIGSVDLVIQISSPRSISAFLQRVGRSGHFVGGTPKGRIFPLTRDDLVEAAALLLAIREGSLDLLHAPEQPLDILAQQIVAEVASRECSEDELFTLVNRSYPYQHLTREKFDEIVEMIAEGFTTRRGRRGAWIHHDTVNGMLRARRGAKMMALTNGGAIPDTFPYDVILEPSGNKIGSVHEDFAVESIPGDIFMLGNGSWMITKVETGQIRVADAQGASPGIPFWEGEAPGRSRELSEAVSRLREETAKRISLEALHNLKGVSAAERLTDWAADALHWLQDSCGLNTNAAEQIVLYLGAGYAGLGAMPTRNTLVMERFFDEAGDMHLVIHSPYGSRLNRAWGLSLRKSFCRSFNFELQAAATEEAIILSLGSTHSFELSEVYQYLKSATVRDILIQAMFDAPMFGTRWRWNATRALAISRNQGGKKVPPHLQRMQSEDLVALVFPDQLACLENIAGDREIPEHPLVQQTIHDCLTELMDIDELEELLRGMEAGKYQLVARDLREPSPLAQEIINAKPYAFLDPAPLEERRTRAIKNRRWLDPADAAELGSLDPAAIEAVRQEAWPHARDRDELHDALVVLGCVTEAEGIKENWKVLFDQLVKENRATTVILPNGIRHWVAVERLPHWIAAEESLSFSPVITLPEKMRAKQWDEAVAVKEIIRGRMEGLGPVTQSQIVASLGFDESKIQFALLGLENEGFIFRGSFTGETDELEWCERRLLARIHRYTLEKLRSEIKPVSVQDFMRFLMEWHRLTPGEQPTGPESLMEALHRLEGFEAQAASWESEILPSRIADYDPSWLDVLCMSGRTVWGRFRPWNGAESSGKAGPIRTSPMTLVSRTNMDIWQRVNGAARTSAAEGLNAETRKVLDTLTARGATFFDELARHTGFLRTKLEMLIAELVTRGLVTSDSFTGLRALLTPASKKPAVDGKHSRTRRATFGMEQAGRWALLHLPESPDENLEEEAVEELARVLLRRYGVVFRRVLDHEPYMPAWSVLLRTYRRMEARGEIRGGRFIESAYGEQYALPEAVSMLRTVRKKPITGALVSLSACDPLCMPSLVLNGRKLSAVHSNRILFRDGEAIAVLESGKASFLTPLTKAEEWELQKLLVQRKAAPRLRAYLG